MKKHETTPEQLAAEFSRILNNFLTPDQITEINRLNTTPDYQNGSCATHNFCDPNQAMIDAWEFLTGEEMELSASDEKMIELTGRAWQIARENGFKAPDAGMKVQPSASLRTLANAIYEALRNSYGYAVNLGNPAFEAHIGFFDDQTEESRLLVEHHEDGQIVNIYATTLNFDEISKIRALLDGIKPKETPFIAAQTTINGIPYLHCLIEL